MKYLRIHFLNVGHGDCTLIEFPDRLTMVDINVCKKLASSTEEELKKRSRASYTSSLLLPGSPLASMLYSRQQVEKDLAAAAQRLTDPIEYFLRKFGRKDIFRYIQTHPDMDHMAGLHRLVKEAGVGILNFWDTAHMIEKEESAKKWQNVNFDMRDWHTYQEIRKGNSGSQVLRLRNGARGQYYSDDNISIWAPFGDEPANDPDADPNQFSYVLHIQFGQCSIVLGGDLPTERWARLYEGSRGNFPKVNLLKASHHGRKSGYHYESVKAMAPDVTIVSVGDLKRKDDGSASYERICDGRCFSTIDHGDIIATCREDGDVWLETGSGKRLRGAPLPALLPTFRT